MTITVTVAPLKNDADVLVVTDEIKLKLPEHDRKASLFYPDRYGNLGRTDPNQLQLEFETLKVIPGGLTVDTTT